jgi:uncharacterized coiled-coil DUF342 family protein
LISVDVELEQLESVVARLLVEWRSQRARADWLDSELAKADEWRAHNKALQAEIERLREALSQVHDWIANSYYGPDEQAEAQAIDDVVIAALEAKP